MPKTFKRSIRLLRYQVTLDAALIATAASLADALAVVRRHNTDSTSAGKRLVLFDRKNSKIIGSGPAGQSGDRLPTELLN